MPRKPAAPDLSFLNTPALSSNVFAGAAADLEPVRQVDIALLDDNPYQPRQQSDPEQLEQLAEVIGAQGFQGTLVARVHPERPGRYQIAFGHRRRGAARLAGLRTLPIQVQDLDDRDMVTIAITENIQREDLTPLDEGRTLLLMSRELELSQEKIAAAIGKTRGYVVNRIRLAQAPEDVQAFLEEKPDSIRAAATLVQIADPAERATLMNGMRSGNLIADDLATYRREQKVQAATPVAPEPPAPAAPPAKQQAPEPDRTAPTMSTPAQAAETPVKVLEVDAASRAQERTARLKLVNALQSLLKYEELVAERDEISLEEFTKLADLRARVELLYERYSPKSEGELLS